ncbi:DUF927 domain-containing protein [Roseovarius spongiae]|uniref:DUF927 domain-containing protein n=1 Tax=Roseovarius spongiae TaxID=2320272 RepID=UPI003CCC64CA
MGPCRAVQEPDGVWHEHILDKKHVLKGSSVVLDSLLECGLMLSSADKAAKSVLELSAAWRLNKRHLSADRLGWTDGSFDAFVLEDSKVIGTKPVVVDGVPTDIEGAIHERGSLDDGREEVSSAQLSRRSRGRGVELSFVFRRSINIRTSWTT